MIHRRLAAHQLLGWLLGAFGALMVLRWVFQIAWVAQAVPGSTEMGLVAPTLFVAAGLCCALLPSTGRGESAARTLLSLCLALLIAVPVLMLVEHVFSVSLGIDFVRVPTPPTPGNPHPGRMSPNACIAFLCAGWACAMVRRSPEAVTSRLYRALLWVVTLIGVAGLIGRFLGLEVLYRFTAHNHLLGPTAFALTLLAVALWLLRERIRSTQRHSFDRHETHITQRSVVALTLVAVGAGVAGFAVMRDAYEKSLGEHLRITASTGAVAITQALSRSAGLPYGLAAHPAAGDALARLARQPADAAARRAAQRVADGFVASGLNGVRLLDTRGRVVASAGVMVRETAASVDTLQSAGAERDLLLWRDGYVFYSEIPLLQGGQGVGRLVSEQRLPQIDRLLEDLRQISDSSDVLVCGREGDNATCAPTRFYRTRFVIPMFKADAQVNLPINRALLGESGVTVVRDLRDIPVMVAYLPLNGFGLGLVLKTDVESLYAPLKARVNVLLAVVAVLVALGMLLLRSQVRPLVNQILTEQRRTQVILDNSHDAFIAIGSDGSITDWNAQAERTFGWSASQAIGQNLAGLIIPAAQRAAHSEGFRRFTLSGDGPVINRRIEVMGLHRLGHEFPIEMSVASFHNGDGYVANAFVRDISERRSAQQQVLASEKRLRAVADNLPALLAHVDAQQRYLFVNAHLARRFGVSADAMVGRSIREGRDPAFNESFAPHVQTVLAGQRVTFDGESLSTGVLRHYHAIFVPDQDERGLTQGFFAMLFDITDRKNSELRQAANELRLRTITDNLPVLISYIDRERRLTFCNGTFESWLGVDPTRVMNRHLADAIGAELYEERRLFIDRAMAGERVNFELSSRTPQGLLNLESTFIPDIQPDGQVAGIYTLTTDVTAFKRAESELSKLARFDSLTQLPNRAQLNEKLEEAVRRSRRSAAPLAVMFLDVDHFKSINDTLGHAAGDAVLVELARRLKASVRETDTVARLSGDEFVIVLEGLHSAEEPQFIARKIGAATGQPWTVQEHTLRVSVSIGVAYAIHAPAPADLLALADKALYRAKAEGRSTFRIEACQD